MNLRRWVITVIWLHIFALHNDQGVLLAYLHHSIKKPLFIDTHAAHTFFILLKCIFLSNAPEDSLVGFWRRGKKLLPSPCDEGACKRGSAELLHIIIPKSCSAVIVLIQKRARANLEGHKQGSIQRSQHPLLSRRPGDSPH